MTPEVGVCWLKADRIAATIEGWAIWDGWIARLDDPSQLDDPRDCTPVFESEGCVRAREDAGETEGSELRLRALTLTGWA